MSYDAEPGTEHLPPVRRGPDPDPRDLEYITTVLDFAGVMLTSKPGDTFTVEELIAKVREVGATEIAESDLRGVLAGYRVFKRIAGGRLVLR
jgi:hypothetical protein